MRKLPGIGMRAKTHKDFEKYALKLLSKLQSILLLNDFYPLKIVFKEVKTSTARCILHYPYKSITIEYGNELFEDWRKGNLTEVTEVLTHEMCHPISDELYCKSTERWASKSEIEDSRERLTDHIANIVLANGLI